MQNCRLQTLSVWKSLKFVSGKGLKKNVLYSIFAETEEGFVNLFIKETGDKVEQGVDAICDLTGNISVQNTVEEDGSPEFRNIRHLLKVTLYCTLQHCLPL